MIQLHPNCEFPGHPLVEVFLVQNTEWLIEYTQFVGLDYTSLGRINKEDGVSVDYRYLQEELAHCQGDIILSFLQARISEKRCDSFTRKVEGNNPKRARGNGFS
ncbi:MAG: hypothetical protein ABIK73_07360 [candidate division WOR-3 bacterium]